MCLRSFAPLYLSYLLPSCGTLPKRFASIRLALSCSSSACGMLLKPSTRCCGGTFGINLGEELLRTFYAHCVSFGSALRVFPRWWHAADTRRSSTCEVCWLMHRRID
ncbi:hypothetical protein TRVL_08227 [Trypanosoma vivax]|nr:hypothetical protein TRVL_08227 [Trypanosoma vivax]